MTIIEPNKSKLRINYIFCFLIIGIIAGIFLNVYFYNQMVNLRYSLSLSQAELEKLQVSSAELKNQLYAVLDSNNLNELVKNTNLILDNRPIYLQDRWQEFASHY